MFFLFDLIAGLLTGVFAIISIFVGFILYILLSYSIYKMGRNKGIDNSWLAFIPLFQVYIMGKISGDINIQGLKITEPGSKVIVMGFVSILLSRIFAGSLLLNLLSLMVYILNALIIYELLKKYKEDYFLSALLCIVFPFLLPIFLFAIRNRSQIRN